MPDNLPPERGRQIDLVCQRFEAAWKSGTPPRIADFLDGWTKPERVLLLRQLVLIDVAYRRQRGETSDELYHDFTDFDPRWLGPVVNGELDQTVAFELDPPGSATPEESTPDPEDTPPHFAPTLAAAATIEPGAVIAGRYTLQEKIGAGGMGQVWIARQTEPVLRQVALKLVKAGLASQAIFARFEQERQTLALMDHPNIARVLDGGLTPSGQPFFVMEFVPGAPVTKFCDQARLPLRERLELFVLICQAVQHAHQKGIVHRDLKPANILVTLLDGKAVPRIIDFGLAKASAGDRLEESLTSPLESFAGTVEYMPPEQLACSSADVDTRADIYSLGIILYELLTGLRPLDANRLKQTSHGEMLRILNEEEPDRPSRRLAAEARLPALAALRQTKPRRLLTLLRDDLDWVVLKCLEKSRERRYETVNGLARDIQRFLAEKPVEAHPPSLRYPLTKFVRRHRGPVLAAALVVLALVGGVVGTTWGLIRANAAAAAEGLAKRDAEDKKQLAEEAAAAEKRARLDLEQELKYAQGIADFVANDLLALTSVEGQDRFGGVGKEALSRNTTLEQLLDRAAAKLNQRRDLDPRIEAELRWMIGVNYRGQGKAALAVPFLERCVTLRQDVLGNDHPDTLKARNSLAVAYRVAGRVPEAIALLEQVRDARARTLGADHLDTISAQHNLAVAYQSAGRLPEAIALFEQVRDARTKALGAENPDTLAVRHNLAFTYRAAGRVPEAIALFEQVRAARTKVLGADHPDTLRTRQALALAYRAAGRVPEAITLLEQVRDEQVKILGAEHPDTLTTLDSLAQVYKADGRLVLAIALYELVRDARVKNPGPEHPDTLVTLNNLAAAYLTVGRIPEAISILERVRDVQGKVVGPNHPDTLTTLNNLAAAYWKAQQLNRSVPLFEEVLQRQQATLGRQHPDTLRTVGNLGVNYKDAGQLEKAILLLEETYRASRTRPTLRWVEPKLLEAYGKAGKTAEATQLVQTQVADARKALPRGSPQLAASLVQSSMTLLQMAAFADAEPLLRECLAIREKTEPESWTTFHTQSLLGAALLGQQKVEEAEPLLRAGYDGMKQRQAKIPRQSQVRLTEALERLVQFAEATGQMEEAAKWRRIQKGEEDKSVAGPEGQR
jgi:serine/threonine protein kinase/tetratricopeptide (TPR) repeat protein